MRKILTLNWDARNILMSCNLVVTYIHPPFHTWSLYQQVHTYIMPICMMNMHSTCLCVCVRSLIKPFPSWVFPSCEVMIHNCLCGLDLSSSPRLRKVWRSRKINLLPSGMGSRFMSSVVNIELHSCFHFTQVCSCFMTCKNDLDLWFNCRMF